MSTFAKRLALAAAAIAFSAAASAQTGAASAAPGGADTGRPAAVIPLESEPAPKLIAYAPLPDALARGVVIIQHRTENLRILPVFGKEAVAVSPHLGHLHVTVDDWKGTWAHTSADPLILVGLTPGPHKVLLEIADPSHKILGSQTVSFTVPPKKGASEHAH
ncbi:DUF6130 family protein [Massilia sp. Root351]|jgi:hypothetical protein|uniref:DUF6130 family protein n=1 Tax=Massilia sp. Root351 TaxID=1736522 RepID=UPI000A827B6A|nr:DUF6130 family protein [Massilia sp. Root351]